MGVPTTLIPSLSRLMQPMSLGPVSYFGTTYLVPGGVPQLTNMPRKKYLRVLKQYGEIPPPSSSHDEDVFAIQKRIFGLADKVNYKTGRKWLSKTRRGPAASMWYDVTAQEIRREIAVNIRKEIKASEDEEIKSELSSILDKVKYSPATQRRRKKLELLKRRGKAPPKKGQGKRAGGKKKK